MAASGHRANAGVARLKREKGRQRSNASGPRREVMTVDNLAQSTNEGNSMYYRDPLAEWHRCATGDPTPAETAGSIAEARAYQRQQRAAFLTEVYRSGCPSFDGHLLDFYAEDRLILLLLPDDVSRCALEVIESGGLQ